MPQPDPIVRAERVRLVDDDFSTEKRERVGRYIEDHWNSQDEITLTKVAEQTGTSRQHVKNVLDSHFEMVDSDRMEKDQSNQPPIPSRDEVDPELLGIVLTAYRIGSRDALSDEIEPGISEELLELATRE